MLYVIMSHVQDVINLILLRFHTECLINLICICYVVEIGSFRCVHCHKLQECDQYPSVGKIFQCMLCEGYNLIMGHYLEFNGMMTMKIQKVPPEVIKSMEKFLEENR